MTDFGYNLLSLEKIENKKIKIILTGESGVGCDSLFQVSMGEKFDRFNRAVNTWECYELNYLINNKANGVILWHGPGQENYKSLLKIFSKDADIVIFVYSMDVKRSCENLEDRIRIVKEISEFKGAIVLNKNDLHIQQEIIVDQGLELAKKYNYKFYSVSAKDNPQAFINCLDELIEEYISTLKFEI